MTDKRVPTATRVRSLINSIKTDITRITPVLDSIDVYRGVLHEEHIRDLAMYEMLFHKIKRDLQSIVAYTRSRANPDISID